MCVPADSIIGLQSFMCTDEMTTGSVLVSSRERRALAAQSHAYNVGQRRFAQMFPEYAGAAMKDLPNMVYLPKKEEATEAPAPTPAPAPAPAGAAASAAAPSGEPAAQPEREQSLFWGPRNVGIAVTAVVAYLFASRLADIWWR